MRSNSSIGSRVIAVTKMDCTGVENVIAQCPESGTSCNSGAASAVVCNGTSLYTIQWYAVLLHCNADQIVKCVMKQKKQTPVRP